MVTNKEMILIDHKISNNNKLLYLKWDLLKEVKILNKKKI